MDKTRKHSTLKISQKNELNERHTVKILMIKGQEIEFGLKK